jgi:YesN/AraC family two-component response regulator
LVKKPFFVIPLNNPERFGIGAAGIGFQEEKGRCVLAVFKNKEVIFSKIYANSEFAKKRFLDIFAHNSSTKAEWGETLNNRIPLHLQVEERFAVKTDLIAKIKTGDKKNIPEMVVEYVITCSERELKRFDISAIAEEFEISVEELSALFLKARKISIAEFVNREKLNRAYFFIESGRDVSIPWIAERLGYSSCASFEKEYEAFFLINPGKFQKIVKQRKKQKLKKQGENANETPGTGKGK